MVNKQPFRQIGAFRIIEHVFLISFFVVVVVLMVFNPSQGINTVEALPSSGIIQAYAFAMPADGWSPLVVNFSAFGSASNEGEIIRYEWDLDGNGRYDTDATDTLGYVNYLYKKSGIYNITLRVTDNKGNMATDSLVVTVRYRGSSSVDYWTIFDDSQVRRVDIQLSSENWDLLWVDPEAKLTVPADAIVFGERIDTVGFRMRGQFSLRETDEKKPWKIDTDAYIDNQEYHNLRQLMFINNIGDPSMLQEKLAYDLMAFAGIPASFTCHIELWIDIIDDGVPADFWGVYTMVERVDRKFLANRFGRENDGGNLYKASHAQRGPMDLIYYGPDISSYPTQNGFYAYGKETNELEADYSDIIYLMYIIDGIEYETPEDFAAALEQVFNIDTFLRYMAVINALGNWDTYPYTGNNFYLYNNPGSGMFEWIPWDLTWGDDPQHPLFGRSGPGLVERAPLYDNVFQVERYRIRYAGYLDLIARTWLTQENVYDLAYTYHTMIDPYLIQGAGDKMYFGESASFTIEAFDNSWTRFAEFAHLRRQFILTTLADDSWKTITKDNTYEVFP